MIFKKKETKEKENTVSTKLYASIQRPIITEKATLLSNNSQVIFSIPMDVSKKNLKEAVEKLFRVNVKKINIIVSKGKTKRFKGKIGKRKNKKRQLFH